MFHRLCRSVRGPGRLHAGRLFSRCRSILVPKPNACAVFPLIIYVPGWQFLVNSTFPPIHYGSLLNHCYQLSENDSPNWLWFVVPWINGQAKLWAFWLASNPAWLLASFPEVSSQSLLNNDYFSVHFLTVRRHVRLFHSFSSSRLRSAVS